jgi:hypothetical protein
MRCSRLVGVTAVVRWIDNNAVDEFLKRLIAAVAEKS